MMNLAGHKPGGFRLSYRTAGDPMAPTILLLHGITGSSRYWTRAEADLGLDHHLLMPDLIGFGESPKPDLDYQIDLFVDTLRTFLEEREITDRPLGLIGHSLGGLVGLEYLARHPDAFRWMVILSLPRYTSREEAHRLFLANSVNYRRILGVNDLQACFSSLRHIGAQVFLKYLANFPSHVVRDSTKFSLRSLLTTLEYCLLDYRIDELLAGLPVVPTLLLHGAHDRVAPLESVSALASRPGWILKTVEGTGHHLFLTNHRRCLEEIRSFLSGPALARAVKAGASPGPAA